MAVLSSFSRTQSRQVVPCSQIPRYGTSAIFGSRLLLRSVRSVRSPLRLARFYGRRRGEAKKSNVLMVAAERASERGSERGQFGAPREKERTKDNAAAIGMKEKERGKGGLVAVKQRAAMAAATELFMDSLRHYGAAAGL